MIYNLTSIELIMIFFSYFKIYDLSILVPLRSGLFK